MFSDQKYSFSVGQKYFFVISKKVNIFHRIEPNHCLLAPTVVVTLACLKAVIGALNKEKVLMSVSSEYWVT